MDKLCARGDYSEVFHFYSEGKLTSGESLLSLEFNHSNRPLHFAAAQGNLEVVRTLIERFNCDASCVNLDGITPIHCASHGGHTKVIEYLVLEQGCDPCVTDCRGSTPLHYIACCAQYTKSVSTGDKKSDHDYFIPNSIVWIHAIEPSKSNIESAKFLIQHGCDPFKRNKRWESPMLPYLMCRCGSLIDFEPVIGQDRRLPLKQLSSLLNIACKFENIQIIERLLAIAENFTQGQQFFKDSFETACLSGNLEVIRMFSGSGKFVPNIDFLFSALKGGNFRFNDKVMAHILKVSGCHPSTKANEKSLIDSFFPVACRQNCPRVANALIVENNDDKLLHVACSLKGIEVARLLVKRSFNQDIKNEEGKLPLHIACEQSSLVLAQLVSSQAGLNVNHRDNDGNTPLHIACQSGNAELVQFLVQNIQCDQNIQNKKKQLPLHITCEHGNTELTKLVSHKVVEVNTKDMKGNTALHIACKSGDSELVRYLTQEKFCNQNVLNNQQQLPLHIVCKHGHSKLARLVSNVDINKQDEDGNTPLHIACSNKESLLLMEHLDKRSKVNMVNKKGELPLHLALSSFPQLPMKFLEALARDVDMHTKSRSGNTPLHMACNAANLDAIKYIVNIKGCGVYSHSDGKDYADLQIHCVCNYLDDNDVELLYHLVTDKNVNVTDSHGDTPLHIACKRNNLKAAIILLHDFEADRGIKNREGEVPLYIACSKSLEMVQIFENINATEAQLPLRHRHNSTTTTRLSPLYNACRHGKVEIVQYLIEVVECNFKSKVHQTEDTLLHVACRYGSTRVAKYLVENEYCNIEEKNANNELPLHLVCGCPTPPNELVKLVGESPEENQFLLIKNKEKKCPLLIACSQGHLGVIKYLIKELGRKIYTKHHFNEALTSVVVMADRNPKHNVIIEYLITKCNANPRAMSGDKSVLEIACSFGDLELVKAITIIDIDLSDHKGNTPLHYACQYSHYNIAEYLLAFHCNQNIQNKQGSLALHIACQESPNLVLLLNLDYVPIEDENGNTPLHLACLYGRNADTVELLLQKSPPCKFKGNKEGHSPLHLACDGALECTHKLQVAKALLKYDPTLADSKAIHIACSQKDIDLLEVLVNSTNINGVDSTGKTPLQVASEQRNYPMINWLIQHGADCSDSIKNDNGNLPLHLCISTTRQSLEAVQALGNSFISVPNKDGNTPVHVACQRFAIDILHYFSKSKMFYEALSLKNNDGCTPLHLIIKQSLSRAVGGLFAIADCDVSDNNGNTPLHIACGTSHSLNVKRLIQELGCKPNGQNNDGDLPLHIAATHSLEMVKSVAISPEITDTCNKAGDTPLHIACRYEEIGIVRYLLKKMNASTNVSNLRKECAIHTVCLLEKESIELFDSVIKHTSPDVLINKDIDGNTPLHLACMRGHFNYILQFVKRFQYSTNIQNNCGETPLHIICKLSRQFKPTEEILTTLKNCDPTSQVSENIPKESDIKPGDTPLHVACRVGEVNIIDSLISSHRKAAEVKNFQLEFPFHVCCRNTRKLVKIISDLCTVDYNSPNTDGDTGLHIAAAAGSHYFDIVKFLLLKLKCDPNLRNKEDEFPLHIACRKGNLRTVKLIGQRTLPCFVNEGDKLGNTPLHEAAMNEDETDCLKYLLHIGCKPEFKNKECEFPIHLACRKGTPYNVALLFKASKDQTFQSMITKAGNTLLHEACENTFYNAERIIEYLKTNATTSTYDSWLSARNSNGDLPLHLACREHSLKVITLLSHPSHDILCCSNEQDDTALHEIFKRRPDRNFQKVINYLLKQLEEISHLEEAINYTNKAGQTPLHLACSKGNLIAVKALLDHGSDPNAKDGEDKSPIVLTTDHKIINALLNHGAHPEPLYQIYKSVISSDTAPPTPVKLLFIGHPGVGKTTLTHSLQKESSMEVVRTTTKGHTAGVIPTNFISQKYGAVTMYDFAGQPEYYPSHDAVLYATITKIPPVVLILFNLIHSNKIIIDQLHFWIMFIANRCAKLTNKAHVIIIGSHADKLKRDPVEKLKQLQKTFKEKFLEQPLTLKGVIHMDCTLSQSTEIDKLHKILENSVSALREKGAMQFTIHCFYVLLINTFKGKVAIHITDILNAIEAAQSDSPFIYLQTGLESLITMCRELDTKGHIMFIEHPTDEKLDWVILEPVKLLHDVSGSLFAPSNFPQHYPLSYSTGVVPLSRLKEYYDEYDPDMLLTFLTKMEYCQKVTDSEILECIVNDEETVENDEYFFFPHLVSLERPTDKWNEDSDTAYKFGWLLQCRNEGEYFSPHFIQALLLRLAFSFAMKTSDESDNETIETESDVYYDDEIGFEEDSENDEINQGSDITTEQSLAQKIVFKRICSVWKNGIYWQDNDGVISIIDIMDQKKLLVLMQCEIHHVVECLQHRSSVMSMVFKTQRELCPGAVISEYFLNPSSLKHPLTTINKQTLFSISKIKRTIEKGKQVIINEADHSISVERLLYFEPYSHARVIKLCNQANSSKQLSEEELDTIADSLDIQDNAAIIKTKLKCLLRNSSTVEDLTKLFDQISILNFRDRQHPKASSQATKRTLSKDYSHVATTGLDLKPALHQLDIIEGNGKTVLVIETVASKWEKVATRLHFGGHTIQQIKRDHRDSCTEACRTVFIEWLDGKGRRPITWETLIKILREAEYSEISRDLEHIMNSL